MTMAEVLEEEELVEEPVEELVERYQVRLLNFVYRTIKSAILSDSPGPNSRAAQSRVYSLNPSLGHRRGFHARFKKNSVGNSTCFRWPTFTIQIRSAPRLYASVICSQTLVIGLVSIHL